MYRFRLVRIDGSSWCVRHLIGWLVGWLVGGLVGWLIDRSIEGYACRPTGDRKGEENDQHVVQQQTQFMRKKS